MYAITNLRNILTTNYLYMTYYLECIIQEKYNKFQQLQFPNVEDYLNKLYQELDRELNDSCVKAFLDVKELQEKERTRDELKLYLKI